MNTGGSSVHVSQACSTSSFYVLTRLPVDPEQKGPFFEILNLIGHTLEFLAIQELFGILRTSQPYFYGPSITLTFSVTIAQFGLKH